MRQGQRMSNKTGVRRPLPLLTHFDPERPSKLVCDPDSSSRSRWTYIEFNDNKSATSLSDSPNITSVGIISSIVEAFDKQLSSKNMFTTWVTWDTDYPGWNNPFIGRHRVKSLI